MKKVVMLIAAFALVGMVSSIANAHLVSFGWKDNGNGTVTLWGRHWHGPQTTAFSANSGIKISGAGITPFTAQWANVHNNQLPRATMVANGTLTGFDDNTGFSDPSARNWFSTVPLVIGNGTFNFITGPLCCIDTMGQTPVQITLTGITSVPPGTGPGGTPVPEPATILLAGLGLAGLGLFGRKRLGEERS
ncbi:MAG: PEP-CTERM sorting domain-containing protein [Nitrospiria bacterium]